MADNLELNAGSGGATLATDDVGGVHFQKMKLDVGADGASAPVSNSNPVPVSDAGGSLTVDNGGTFAVQAAQSGTWNVTNVSGTVSLPTGAATAAKQPALGTAGSASADVISIQGIASMTAIQVADNGGSLTVDNGGTFAVQVSSIAAGNNNIGDVDVASLPALPAGTNAIGTVTAVGAAAEDAAASGNPVLVGGRYDSTPRTLETGDAGAIALNASGQVLVEIAAGAGSGGTAAADDADFTAGTTSATPVMGVYESSPSSVTDGDMGVVGITQTRALKVAIASGGISGIADDAAFTPGTSEVLPIGFTFDDTTPDSVNEGDIGAARMSANRNLYTTIRDAAGNERGVNINASNQMSVIDANSASALTALQLIDNACIADDAAFTPGSTGVTMAGFEADESSTDSVDEGDGGAARMTLDRKQIVTPYPHTAGGLAIHRSIDLDEGTLEVVKNAPGQVYGMWVTNTATATRFIKFYDATSGTAGTGTPVITIGIPGNSSDDVSGNFGPGGMGITFGTGICVGATTGVADADTGAPGANEVIVNIFYK